MSRRYDCARWVWLAAALSATACGASSPAPTPEMNVAQANEAGAPDAAGGQVSSSSSDGGRTTPAYDGAGEDAGRTDSSGTPGPCSVPSSGGATREPDYAADPDAIIDTRVALTANGTPYKIERYTIVDIKLGTVVDSSLVRIPTCGPVDASLSILDPSIAGSGIRLAMAGKNLPFTKSGNSVNFTLPGPGRYYLKLDENDAAATSTFYFFVDDAADVYKVIPNALAVSTAADLKSSLSPANNGKTIYVQPGIYSVSGGLPMTGLKDMTVFLAPGALVKNALVGGVSDVFCKITNCSNLTIDGYGTLDALGLVKTGATQKESNRHVMHTTVGNGSSGVSLKNLWLKSGSGESIIFAQGSQNSMMDGTLVLSGRDVVDFKQAHGATVQNSVLVGVDDVAVKTTATCGGDVTTCQDITVQNNIICSSKSALKVGTETCPPGFKNIQFVMNDVVDGERGMVISAYDGGSIGEAASPVLYRHNRLFMSTYSTEHRSGDFIEFGFTATASEARPPGATNIYVTVDSCYANVFKPGILQGFAGATTMGTFKNLMVRMDKTINPLFNISDGFQTNPSPLDSEVKVVTTAPDFR
jgi:hypothetical protein